ncbi:methionine ABC transporter, substrate binding lipoprotein [Dellaglioa algida]|uniref:Lipoprotein n=2 Tax=Dellaglioa TaxID=2767880 RepID=A0A2C8EMG9_9LACO|nr:MULTISPECIES: MetQ/NlpA family ABC transporter substrate-binding protein [Dellaglioa]MCZ2490699.1 MetQ/NlpA family ABC transporter substrate-binding protein [Dellaglioa carnosa]MCZ2493777.1 MetQ/NlpA family ABC transporter substrate-binding protein [Dellaglioa carnosa]MDK1716828.1 MetQ/NlpA family ABC transporter substrate-binding protein [Dellaglioa algida]MDK1719191.1 MetQ/NlpA family ABC transporter substrate-binding protein [Dellaglioa algida]MDK1719602.1 MetQ/NlpA family ABC transporte
MMKINKKLFFSLLFVIILLTGCGKRADDKNTLVVGASNIPHAEILAHVKPMLAKEGIDLKVKVFQDYVMPNKATESEDLDANYFQHKPFLDNWDKQNNGDLISVGNVHLEPIGVYSKRVKRLTDLKKGSTVLVSNSISDYGRVLTIFKDAGLITLKKGTDVATANFNDIQTNKLQLNFKHTYEPKLMSDLYANDEGAAVVINANYAVEAGLNPMKQAISLESNTSSYANLVAVTPKNKNNPAIKKLVEALQSKDTQKWILTKYKGAVIPAK